MADLSPSNLQQLRNQPPPRTSQMDKRARNLNLRSTNDMGCVVKSEGPDQILFENVDNGELQINSVSSKSNCICIGTPNQKSELLSNSRKSGYESSYYNLRSDENDQPLEPCFKPVAQFKPDTTSSLNFKSK